MALAAGIALFLLVLPFHLVVKWLVPGPVGTYWKEGLLGLLVVLWALLALAERRLPLTRTPLDGAVLLYVGLLLLRFLLDRNWAVGAWGLYISILYLPLFWLVPWVLGRRPRWFVPLLWLLVGVGAVVAAGGLIEFAFDVPLWPSVERMGQQGFPGVFIYATHIRRVYFTFDSPTALANTLAMLLPLALALLLVSRGWLPRLAAGLAAALLGACIVVTFSRGIWVATVLSLLVMGVVGVLSTSGRRRAAEGGQREGRNWKPLLIVGGALALLAVVWALALLLRTDRGAAGPSAAGVVELSASAYGQMVPAGVSADLLGQAPAGGEADLQTWTLLDPVTGAQDTRRVLFEHPPELGITELIYTVPVPENGALQFAIALSPEVWSPDKGDGASFEVYVADPAAGQAGQPAFVRYINPKHVPSDRRWRSFLVDLSPWAGRTVNLSLVTSPGRTGDWSFDWAGWAEPRLVSVEPGFFASARAENAVLKHTGSILDWAQDETNRDRLAAWGSALRAWQSAPLWGQGLGSTGVAALRTQPAAALVTESQVLKALVELGPLGLLVLAFLWFQVGRVGWKAYRAGDDPRQRTLLLGILTSLLIVLIEGWVYQNLEVKQVNACFWTLLGALAFAARTPDFGSLNGEDSSPIEGSDSSLPS